ncbi:hypothetical protein EW026_g3682 [Hermanssonia centrifuga]|uniref:Uncharacterized protein n=1 Tax=Hermanssonia centrifuga TaxID=98765 RepID=A0A4S4KJW9_9APHY|nr:hypothetical protein EW026_g3682 [Hermanssonia centrifuga]
MAAIRVWNNQPLRPAVNIVRRVVFGSETAVTIQELYKLALQQPYEGPKLNHVFRPSKAASDPKPPNPEHPIRSMSYLRNVILPELERRQCIEKVHEKRELAPEEIEVRKNKLSKAAQQNAQQHMTVSVWAWKRRSPRPVPKPKPVPEVFGKEVGVGDDISHLNRRRQNSRKETVLREVAWLQELQKARREGAAASSKTKL